MLEMQSFSYAVCINMHLLINLYFAVIV